MDISNVCSVEVYRVRWEFVDFMRFTRCSLTVQTCVLLVQAFIVQFGMSFFDSANTLHQSPLSVPLSLSLKKLPSCHRRSPSYLPSWPVVNLRLQNLNLLPQLCISTHHLPNMLDTCGFVCRQLLSCGIGSRGLTRSHSLEMGVVRLNGLKAAIRSRARLGMMTE